MLRAIWSYCGSILLFLASSLTLPTRSDAATPPPPALHPYLTSGQFEPGDYAWMRGRFSDASPADKAVWTSIQDWLLTCKVEDQKEMQQQMRTLGIENPQANDGPFGDFVCDEVGISIPHLSANSVGAFKAMFGDADLAARSISWTMELTQQFSLRDEAPIEETLRARVMIDQMLRRAATADNFGGAVLSDDQMALVRSRVWLAIRRVDRENTAWLKKQISRHGWIDAKKYGEVASDAAWLLVQHADQDPLFQYHMLRALDPTLRRGEPKVSPRKFALLKDRVMLKFTGRQIYGSQLVCRSGTWAPFPIENEPGVEARRAQVGLSPLRVYIADFVRSVGPCNL